MEYIVVEEEELEDLIKRVNGAIEVGFEPIGGVAVRPEDENFFAAFYQAMIRRPENVSDWQKEEAAQPIEAEQIAALFHRLYEELAPQFGYTTRPESAVPWSQVPENNRYLMTTVVRLVLQHIGLGRDLLCADCGKPYSHFQLDTVLPNEQWKLISPTGDEGGILCAACIVARGAKLPDVTVAKLIFE